MSWHFVYKSHGIFSDKNATWMLFSWGRYRGDTPLRPPAHLSCPPEPHQANHCHSPPAECCWWFTSVFYHQVQSGLDIHGLALLRSTSHIRRHYTLRTTGCSRIWYSLAWFKRGGFPKYVHCSIILQIPYRFPTLQVRQFSLKQVKGDLWIPWVNWAQAIQSTFLCVRGDITKLFVCVF